VARTAASKIKNDAATAEQGTNARSLRQKRKLTLDQLAEVTGLSKGHLSRFERGEASLSVAALMRLAQALGTSVSFLLGEDVDQDAIHLVRVGDRKTSHLPAEDGGYRYSLLSRSDQPHDMEVFTVELTAGASVAGKVSHGGKEGFFVVSGDVEIEVADQIFRLRQGDYLEFPANLRHATRSRSPRATVLVIVSP
jgi:transcriptional regulator with XRE-family HTH domain